jgi:membrane-associated phospholipid phosphatase
MSMRLQVARWISILAHPFVMVALLITAGRSKGTLGDLLLVGGAILLPLALLMVAQVRRQRWSNVDASNPRERPLLFAVALGGAVTALAFLMITTPESRLIRGITVSMIFLAVAGVLTRWVKLSLHVAFAMLTGTALTLTGSPIGPTVLAAVPALMWSRVVLGRHRMLELLVGLLLGAVAGVAMVRL